jgi:hypothetical protein
VPAQGADEALADSRIVLGSGAVLAVPAAEVLQIRDQDLGVVDVLGRGQQRLEKPVPLCVHRGWEQRAQVGVAHEEQSVEVRGDLVGDGGHLGHGAADTDGVGGRRMGGGGSLFGEAGLRVRLVRGGGLAGGVGRGGVGGVGPGFDVGGVGRVGFRDGRYSFLRCLAVVCRRPAHGAQRGQTAALGRLLLAAHRRLRLPARREPAALAVAP